MDIFTLACPGQEGQFYGPNICVTKKSVKYCQKYSRSIILFAIALDIATYSCNISLVIDI